QAVRRVPTVASKRRIRGHGRRISQYPAHCPAPWWKGLGRRQGERRGYFLLFPTKGRSMRNGMDILLVEDSPEDVEITLRAFQKYNLSSKVHVVQDGEEALEWIFCTGRHAGRSASSDPRLILLVFFFKQKTAYEILQRCKSDPRT